MGVQADKNFKKRFKKGIKCVYLKRSLKPAEERLRNEMISKAYVQLMRSILQREPTEKEILGITDISETPSVSPP